MCGVSSTLLHSGHTRRPQVVRLNARLRKGRAPLTNRYINEARRLSRKAAVIIDQDGLADESSYWLRWGGRLQGFHQVLQGSAKQVEPWFHTEQILHGSGDPALAILLERVLCEKTLRRVLRK